MKNRNRSNSPGCCSVCLGLFFLLGIAVASIYYGFQGQTDPGQISQSVANSMSSILVGGLAGGLFAMLQTRRGNLIAPYAAHLAFNLVEFLFVLGMH